MMVTSTRGVVINKLTYFVETMLPHHLVLLYRCNIPTGNDSMLIMVNKNILYVGLHPSGGICTLTFQIVQ